MKTKQRRSSWRWYYFADTVLGCHGTWKQAARRSWWLAFSGIHLACRPGNCSSRHNTNPLKITPALRQTGVEKEERSGKSLSFCQVGVSDVPSPVTRRRLPLGLCWRHERKRGWIDYFFLPGLRILTEK